MRYPLHRVVLVVGAFLITSGCAATLVDTVPEGTPKGWVEFYLPQDESEGNQEGKTTPDVPIPNVLNEEGQLIGRLGWDPRASCHRLRVATTGGVRSFTVQAGTARPSVRVETRVGQVTPVLVHISNVRGSGADRRFDILVLVQSFQNPDLSMPESPNRRAEPSPAVALVNSAGSSVQANAPATLTICDARLCPKDGRVVVAAGAHRFYVSIPDGESAVEQPTDFLARPGRKYAIGASLPAIKRPTDEWFPYVEDTETGDWVAIGVAPPAPSPRAPDDSAPRLMSASFAAVVTGIDVELGVSAATRPVLHNLALTVRAAAEKRNGVHVLSLIERRLDSTLGLLRFDVSTVLDKEKVSPGAQLELVGLTYVEMKSASKAGVGVGLVGVARGDFQVELQDATGPRILTIKNGTKIRSLYGYLQ